LNKSALVLSLTVISQKLPSITLQKTFPLTALEKQHGNLSEVEVDEVLGLVCYVAAEVSADNAVPSRVVLLVELLLDEGGDILLDVVLLQCLHGAINCVLLHVLCHIGILDNGFPVRRHLVGVLTCSLAYLQ